MSFSTLWKAAAAQTIAVAVLSIVVRLIASKDAFEDWGWVIGPVAWIVSAAFTARVLRLPLAQTLTGAAGAGLVSAAFVIAGLHWLGAVCAIALFAVWCARLREDPELPAEVL